MSKFDLICRDKNRIARKNHRHYKGGVFRDFGQRKKLKNPPNPLRS